MAPWIVVSLHAAPPTPTPAGLSHHRITEGSSLRIYIFIYIHRYLYIIFVLLFFFQLPSSVLCHYYYPETLRAAGNSKSLKVIRSDLINEFYYLAVMRSPARPPPRGRRPTTYTSAIVAVHTYIYIYYIYACTKTLFCFALQLTLSFFSSVYLFICFDIEKRKFKWPQFAVMLYCYSI